MHTVRNFNHKYMEKRGVDEQSHRDNSDTELIPNVYHNKNINMDTGIKTIVESVLHICNEVYDSQDLNLSRQL